MNGKGLALMTIAVVAVGVFALPSTVSLFSGQHTWYDLSGKGNNVPCEKCHADIAEEMEQIGPHTGETGYKRMKCEYCHRIFPVWRKNSNFSTYTYAYANGTTTVEPGKEAHAASTVPCLYCHSGNKSGVRHSNYATGDCWSCHQASNQNPNGKPAHEGTYTNNSDCRRCHANKNTNDVYYIPPAGGFGLTIDTADTGTYAAHKKFVNNANNTTLMENANEACIACHTHIAVKINWTHAYSLEFNVTPEFKLQQTHFNVSDFSANGTANVTVYGNATGAGSTSGFL